MRTFSPLAIARIKLRISNIVGEEETACAERSATVEVVYIEITGDTENQNNNDTADQSNDADMNDENA